MQDTSSIRNRSLSSSNSLKQTILESDPEVLSSYISDIKANLYSNKKLVQNLIFSQPNESLEEIEVDSTTSLRALEALMLENMSLEEKIDQVIEERNKHQSKSLLNEQIRNECGSRHQEIMSDYEEQISELNFQNERKEKVICDLRHLNNVLRVEADIAHKSKYVLEVKPSLEILPIHCKVEMIRELMEEKAREIYLLKTQKREIVQFIESVKKEILKIKALVVNPINRKNKIGIAEKTGLLDADLEDMAPEIKFNKFEKYRGCVTEGGDEQNELEEEIWSFKQEIVEKSEKLIKVSEKNSKYQKENEKLTKENERLNEKIEHMLKSHEKSDLTMEVNHDYENSLLNHLKLDSISEIEINHSQIYEKDLSHEYSM